MVKMITVEKFFDGIQMPTVLQEQWYDPHRDWATGSLTEQTQQKTQIFQVK